MIFNIIHSLTLFETDERAPEPAQAEQPAGHAPSVLRRLGPLIRRLAVMITRRAEPSRVERAGGQRKCRPKNDQQQFAQPSARQRRGTTIVVGVLFLKCFLHQQHASSPLSIVASLARPASSPLAVKNIWPPGIQLSNEPSSLASRRRRPASQPA